MRTRAAVLAIASVIILGACGGGGGTPSATVVSVELVRFWGDGCSVYHHARSFDATPGGPARSPGANARHAAAPAPALLDT